MLRASIGHSNDAAPLRLLRFPFAPLAATLRTHAIHSPRVLHPPMSWSRRILVHASESAWLREHATHFRFVRRASRRFLPGENLDDALSAARRLAENGVTSLITHLGENVRKRDEAAAVTRDYLGVLERIRSAGLPAEISVKLTQLGLDIDREFSLSNLLQLIEASRAANSAPPQLVWIDMEQSAYVDATLDVHRRARQSRPNVGICVQAYLRRTAKDVEALVSMGAAVRLVKGAYSEPPEIAFEKKSDVDENFFRLAQVLLSPDARRAGVRAVLGTHDASLIARICDWAAAQNVAKNHIEFAMLYGIQRAEQLRLARDGYGSCVLISYGSYWFPWYMRRLAERPANLWFVARNLFSK